MQAERNKRAQILTSEGEKAAEILASEGEKTAIINRAEAVYEINLDYLMSLNGHSDVFGIWWDRRNADLRFVLTPWQYCNPSIGVLA